MFALMLFMFFFFVGFVAMFAYLLKQLNDQARALKDEHAQLRVLLRAMESRLDKMAHIEKLNALFQGQLEGGSNADKDEQQEAATDPLLHLSFEPPSSLDENMGRRLDLQPESRNWDLELATGRREES